MKGKGLDLSRFGFFVLVLFFAVDVVVAVVDPSYC